VLHAVRHHEELPRSERHRALGQVDLKLALEHQEEIVGVGM
jgi:hypothetical protein